MSIRPVVIIISIFFPTEGSDYVAVNQPLTFSMDEDRQCFNVSLLDDDVLELPEDLLLDLESDDSMVILDPRQADVIINDTDRE